MYRQAAELPGLHCSGKSVWAVWTVCERWRPPQRAPPPPPPAPSFCFSATQQQVHSGSKDEKQLGFIAATRGRKSAVRLHADRNVPCVGRHENSFGTFLSSQTLTPLNVAEGIGIIGFLTKETFLSLLIFT